MKAHLAALAFASLASQCFSKPKQQAVPAPAVEKQSAPLSVQATSPSAPAPAAQLAALPSDPDSAKGGCGSAKLKEGRNQVALPMRPKPAKGAEQTDPSFGTCVVRATDHAKERIDTFSRSDYSRRQAFNANSTFFITSSRDGGWYLYDANTLELNRQLQGPSGDAEPQWHPSDPSILYYGERNGGLTIKALNVHTGSSTVAADLKGAFPWPNAARAWSKSEGSPSRDARYWPFQVETENFEILGFAVWDMKENKLVGSIPRKSRPDHVSMTPSGRWFVSSGDDEGTVAWSPDFKQKRVLHKKSEHSDLAIGADGHDYYVSIDYQSGAGYVFMIDIDRERRVELFPTYINGAAAAMHFSGKAFDKPGWVLVSTYNGSGPAQWYMEKLFAMELHANPRIYQLAAHHSAVKDEYFAEPQATVNRDFTRVLFDSNWGATGSPDVDTYLVKLKPGAFP